jgi:hypothetical protein
MKNLILSLYVCFTAIGGYCQNTTLRNNEKNTEIQHDLFIKKEGEKNYSNIIIIPFEPKLYRSEIDRDISKRNDMNFEEIRNAFRKGLNNSMFIEAKQSNERAYGVVSLLGDDADGMKDLEYIYKSIGYQNKICPADSQPNTTEKKPIEEITGKIKNTFSAENKESENKNGIYNGQVMSADDNLEKYMSTTIINPNLLNYLAEKYNAGLFVFINQLDLVVAPGTDYRAFEQDNYPRLAKLHYSILNKEGEEVYGSVAKSWFTSRQNDTEKIIHNNILEACKIVASHIPSSGTVSTAQSTQKVAPAAKQESIIKPAQEKKKQTAVNKMDDY